MANLLEKKAFTVSMATVSTMAEADYLGIVSGTVSYTHLVLQKKDLGSLSWKSEIMWQETCMIILIIMVF